MGSSTALDPLRLRWHTDQGMWGRGCDRLRKLSDLLDYKTTAGDGQRQAEKAELFMDLTPLINVHYSSAGVAATAAELNSFNSIGIKIDGHQLRAQDR